MTLLGHFVAGKILVVSGDLVYQLAVRKDLHDTVCSCLYLSLIHIYTTAEENKTTATENDVLTEESAEKLLTDVVRSDALKDALASGDTVSSDLLADFKNKALQEDEEEDEVETLTLDQETMDDAVDTLSLIHI